MSCVPPNSFVIWRIVGIREVVRAMSETRESKRNVYDAYYTPSWCYERLGDHIDFGLFKTALEPACGDGRITDFLRKYGVSVTEYDIQRGVDYLAQPAPKTKYELIMTNPPFSLADSFFKKALAEAEVVIMLQRNNYLSSQGRYDFWVNNPPTGLVVCSRRPSFTGGGKTDAQDYMWYIFDSAGVLPSGIKFIR